ncbi:MAG: hypothetical protein ISR76_00515 [Planctomycetes bacterium]|nr:hypothetical protein [Planctomycetota bacterium]
MTAAAIPVLLLAQLLPAPDAPVELGRVVWERDFDRASLRAAAEEKPLLLLFQEVPG